MKDKESRQADEKLKKGIEAWEEGNYADAWGLLSSAAELGSMKAGRYLALIALRQAAERGDITSKVILGTLYEFGYGLPHDAEKAKEMYESALENDHPNREGFMLAAGADLGMGRLCMTENAPDKAKQHFMKARDGGEDYIHSSAERNLKTI